MSRGRRPGEGLRQVERRAVVVEELQIVVDDRPALEQGVPERVPDRDVAIAAVAERQLLHHRHAVQRDL